MACSTCMAVRRAVNVPLQRLGLPSFPVQTSVQQPAASPGQVAPAQRKSNPAWPTRNK